MAQKPMLRSYKISGNISRAYVQIEVVSRDLPTDLAARFKERMRATSVTLWVKSRDSDHWVYAREL